MTPVSWPCPLPGGGTARELALAFDAGRSRRVLIVPALFDEGNRLRRFTVEVMRRLANGSDRDIPLVAGESGAAGFAGLLALRGNAEWARRTQLDADACVLLINTEGATAPAIYEELAGQSAETVLRRQAAWKDAATGL